MSAAAVLLVAALAAAWLSLFYVHMSLMLFGALVLFPFSVAVAYVASGARGRGPGWGVALMSAGEAAALLAAGAAAAGWWRLGLVLAGAAGLLGCVGAASSSLGVTGPPGWSLRGVAAAGCGLSAASAALLASGAAPGPVAGLSVALGYDLPLIYAVTAHSVPMTFRRRPRWAAAFAGMLASAAGGALAGLGFVAPGAALGAAGLPFYAASARLEELPGYLREASRRPGAAGAGLRYFAIGHAASLAAAVLAAAYTLLYAAGACDTPCLLHGYTLGFISIHVWIHAPMMLPVILRVRHRRRYNPLPYLLALLAALAFPASGPAALALYAASAAAAALVFL